MIKRANHYLRRGYQLLRDRGVLALTNAIIRRLSQERLVLNTELSFPPSVEAGYRVQFPSQRNLDVLLIAACSADGPRVLRWIAHTRSRYEEHPFKLHALLMRSSLRDQLPWSEMNVTWQHCRSSESAAEAYNACAHSSTQATLVLTSDRIAIQLQALAILRETLWKSPRTAVVTARVLRADGLQRERYVQLARNGHGAITGIGSDPHQPEDAFLRPVDFAQGDLVAIRREQFLRLGGFRTGWATPELMIADFTLRLHAHRLLTCYQPQAYALDLADAAQPRSPLASASRPDVDGVTFRHRWTSADLWGIHAYLSSATSSRDVRKRALVVDHDFPAPDRDSGSLRLTELLRLMQLLGFEITLATIGLQPRPKYVPDLQRNGVRCLYRPYVKSMTDHLRDRGGSYEVVMLCRMETAEALIPDVRQHCPKAALIFDTVDLHFLRFARQARLTQGQRQRAIAERAKRTELRLVDQADHTFVVSDVERELLMQFAPRSNVHVVSNIHRTVPRRASFAERAGILFVGGFSHPPNLDAVIYFAEQVFPLVRNADPDIRCFVVGADPPMQVRNLSNEHMNILGYQPSLEPFLNGCRLSVAPLRFGAGVKGKIHQSLSYGLPAVATSIAAEGMHLRDGESVLIADSPEIFAKAILRLYRDEGLWRRLSTNGIKVIREHFSANAAMKTLRSVLQVQ